MADYPSTVVARARELHDVGFGTTYIARILAREFDRAPHQSTVKLWCSPKVYARHMARSRERDVERGRQHSGRLTTSGRPRTEGFKQARCRSLLDLGLDAERVALVMAFDFDEPWTPVRVRAAAKKATVR